MTVGENESLLCGVFGCVRSIAARIDTLEMLAVSHLGSTFQRNWLPKIGMSLRSGRVNEQNKRQQTRFETRLSGWLPGSPARHITSRQECKLQGTNNVVGDEEAAAEVGGGGGGDADGDNNIKDNKQSTMSSLFILGYFSTYFSALSIQ